MMCKAIYLVVVLLLVFLGAGQANAADDLITLIESKPYVAQSNQIQRFEEYISLNKGYEQLPLILKYHNGSPNTPAFKWLRISSPSMRYVTENDFKDGVATIDITGEVSWGTNQILITGAGPKGATLTWTLSTPKVTVDGIQPGNVQTGQIITISGTNLPAKPALYSVAFNDTPGLVESASSNKLIVRVPDDATAGTNRVVVSIIQKPVGSGTVNVASVATLTGLSDHTVPPGSQITIYGDNFSDDPQRNQVFIGPFQAQVIAATKTSLTIVIPVNYGNMFPQWYQPVKVIVNGVRARNQLSINVQLVG